MKSILVSFVSSSSISSLLSSMRSFSHLLQPQHLIKYLVAAHVSGLQSGWHVSLVHLATLRALSCRCYIFRARIQGNACSFNPVSHPLPLSCIWENTIDATLTLTVTFLTPFSLSPMTDTAVDSLPALFLAYCTLCDADDVISIDDRITPRPSALDPTPLYSPY